jgi:hypothetical protein
MRKRAMTHKVLIAVGAEALLTMSSVVALADSSQRGQSAYDAREIPILMATTWLPPYGYSPSFWGYGGRRYYDRFGNYKKYGQEPGEPDTGPVETRPLR